MRPGQQAVLTEGRLRDAVELRRRRARGAPTLAEQVVLRALAGVAAVDRLRLLRGQLDRVVERHAAGARTARSPGGALADRDRLRVLRQQLVLDGLAVRGERVRLPVVELEPCGLPDLRLGARGVGDVRKPDDDLI